ncbi:MAG: c-type cytochrome [Halieaceae bacterium]|jgi:mono/diheme cytochrome c family protein|nr:c-type cytochrome [Halieaceae bacterium]
MKSLSANLAAFVTTLMITLVSTVSAQEAFNVIEAENSSGAMGVTIPKIASEDPAVARGEYFVTLLGCASCHTDGALLGTPNTKLTLAGSSVGIAYLDPTKDGPPGVLFPPNLTPDNETGIGTWSEDEIIKMLLEGEGRHGPTPVVMPWVTYSNLHRDDAVAIARYLKSLEPVRHPVPSRVAQGSETDAPLVYVGLYRGQ